MIHPLRQRNVMEILFIFVLYSIAAPSTHAASIYFQGGEKVDPNLPPPRSGEKVDPNLPPPVTIRVDDKTLDEIDKELEKAGLSKRDRDVFIEQERQRREKGKRVSSGSVHSMGYSLDAIVNCPEDVGVTTWWSSGGPSSVYGRSYDRLHATWTAWSAPVFCNSYCDVAFLQPGVVERQWYKTEAWNSMLFPPFYESHSCWVRV